MRLVPSIGLLLATAFLLNGCGAGAGSGMTAAPPSPLAPSAPPTVMPTAEPVQLSIALGETNDEQGISLDQGGDVDTLPTADGRTSGNGASLSAADGNTIADSYLQFQVDDRQLFKGDPTSHVRVEVEYLDQGTDTFSIQYDAQPVSGSDGLFYGGGAVVKTNTGAFLTASFNLCNAYFANRDNGADFRISDNGDGAETIHLVRVVGLLSGRAMLNVDDFGADPFDDQPDSTAIQAALDSTCSGDMVVFTSGVDASGYQGYRIDKTLFLTGMSAKQKLTFTASDPSNHALLTATADLKGYVVRLFARSRFTNSGDIDDIDFGYIDINGGREVRTCMGSDNSGNGVDDNWGSWLPECTVFDDPWCSPGNIGMDGAMNTGNVSQDYRADPALWTSGIVVHDLVDQQGECGSALAFGGAAGIIRNVTIDTVGDHVHAWGCAMTDDDGDEGAWSDGITLFGPAHQVIDNVIINPSDIGIVSFGGRDTIIANNTIRIEAGNYGAFGAIALHSWDFSDASGIQITGNIITSEGDTKCGGLHAGINIGPHMWGGACLRFSTAALVGNSACSREPSAPDGTPCTGGQCQLWSSLPAGATFMLKDNTVTGAHINYLIEGFDILGTFIDENNVSETPRRSDWQAARAGCDDLTWGALDKVAHHPSLPGYTDLRVHCER